MHEAGAAVEFEDAVGDAVEHVTVMGDEQQPAAVLGQPFLQPRDRADVEVVRRLVEHEEVRLGHEQARQRRALGLATAELADGRVEQTAHAELVENRLGLPPVAHGVAHRGTREHGALIEVADADVASASHHTRFRFDAAGQHVEQRRLAGAVEADDGGAVARRHRHRQVAEKRPVGSAHRDARCVDEDHRGAGWVVTP